MDQELCTGETLVPLIVQDGPRGRSVRLILEDPKDRLTCDAAHIMAYVLG